MRSNGVTGMSYIETVGQGFAFGLGVIVAVALLLWIATVFWTLK